MIYSFPPETDLRPLLIGTAAGVVFGGIEAVRFLVWLYNHVHITWN